MNIAGFRDNIVLGWVNNSDTGSRNLNKSSTNSNKAEAAFESPVKTFNAY